MHDRVFAMNLLRISVMAQRLKKGTPYILQRGLFCLPSDAGS